MKIKRSALKEIIKEVVKEQSSKEVITEAEGLDHYLSGKYDEYKYGEPVAAANILKGVLKAVEKALVNPTGYIGFKKAIKKAGDALGPGVAAAFKKDLKDLLRKHVGDITR